MGGALALALLTGAAWALAAPPRGWWPLLPLGAAALAIAVHGRRPRARLLLGAGCGVALYTPSLLWLTDFAVAGFVAMVAVETGMLALAVACVPARAWWALPAALVGLEAAQAVFPFGGFPVPSLVLGQLDGPFVLAAPLGGGLLVTGAAAAAGVAIAAPLLVAGRRRLPAVGLAAVGAVLPLVAGTLVTTTPAGTMDVALVQGGGPRGLRAVFTDPAATTARHLAVAETIAQPPPDLVLLPENVVTVGGPVVGSAAGDRIAALARRLGAPVVAGVVERAGDRFRNAAVLWDADGRAVGRYDKEHRVPFGEYIPARALIERVTDLTALVPRDAVAGTGDAVLHLPDVPLGVVISYEVFFADRVREAVTAGGEVVLVPTNAASYVTEEVPAAEVAAARLRAREFGRTVLQAAPTGYTAVVLPSGEVVAIGGLGDPVLLRETVPLRTGTTPYARAGDLPVIGLALVLLVTALARRRA